MDSGCVLRLERGVQRHCVDNNLLCEVNFAKEDRP